MGTLRDSKSLTAIQDAIEAVIAATDSTLDLSTGEAVKDIVVDAPASQFRALYVLADFMGNTADTQALLDILDDDAYLEDLESALPEKTAAQIVTLVEDYIDALANNFGLTRRAAIAAQYRQRFYRSDNNGGAPLTIPTGTRVQNLDGTLQAEVLVSTPQVPQIDSSKGMYYVEETVVVTAAGSGGNTALNSLVRFVAAIPSLATDTGNVETLVSGQAKETSADLVTRIRDSFRGRNINTVTGYENVMKADPLAFTDALVVGPGDDLMTRLATGGIDIYVIGSAPATISESFVYSSLTTEYLLGFQPALSLLSVVGSVSGTADPADFELTVDDGTFAESAKARRSLGILNPSAFVVGESLTVTYTFDTKIRAAQNLLETDDYHVPDADELVKKASLVAVNVDIEVILDGSVQESTAKANIQADFAVFFAGGTTSRGTVLASYGIGQRIDKSDILGVLTRVSGVDRIDLDTFVVETSRDGVVTTESTDPVVLAANEYARAGTVTFL